MSSNLKSILDSNFCNFINDFAIYTKYLFSIFVNKVGMAQVHILNNEPFRQ